MDNYLDPAIEALKGVTTGYNAGEVFHEFAIFCDAQLQIPQSHEDLLRAQKVSERREKEVDAYFEMLQNAKNKNESKRLERQHARSVKWYEMEKGEYDRLYEQRQTSLRMSLQNYLLSLTAADQHDDDVLRFVALWLEFADSSLTDQIVKKFLPKAPSRKFARVMNQLSSRQQRDDSEFQKSLANLVFRICRDHPYHGLYQLFSNSSPPKLRDEASKSRQTSAVLVVQRLMADKMAKKYWDKVYGAHQLYDKTAMFKDKDWATDQEYDMSYIPVASEMSKKIPKLDVPPSTMTVDLRSDCNYEDLPVITRFRTKMRIAGGISAPKIITAIASDGQQYRQLVRI